MDQAIIEAIIEKRDFEFLGTTRVRILKANLAIMKFAESLKKAITKR